MIKNEYHDRLDHLITDHHEVAPSVLRKILDGLYKGRREVIENISNADYLKKKITLKDGVPEIKAAALKNHTKKNIIDALASNPSLKYRAAIIFHHLCKYEKDDNISMDDLNNSLEQIIKQQKFPHPQSDNPLKEGVEDDYSTANSIFTPGKRSKKKALIFATAVLGVDLDFLEKSLKNYQPEIKKDKRKRKAVMIVLLLIFGGGISIWYLGAPDPPYRLFGEINSSELFGSDYIPMDQSVPKSDSIALNIVQLESKELLVRNDSIPLNHVWIRLMISNYSEQLQFYPDGLFYQPAAQEHMAGKTHKKEVSFLSDSKSTLELPIMMNRVFEWRIINDQRSFFIRPRSRIFIFFKLESDESTKEGVYSFHLSLDGFDQNKRQLNAQSEQIRLAID